MSATPTLVGHHVRLEPLDASHASGLEQAAADGALWTLPFTSVPAPGDAPAYIAAALAARERGDAIPFVVRDAAGEVIGSTRYYDVEPSVPNLHIGYTWYAARAQRTRVNTEAKKLLLAHAFGTMGCEAVMFETSHLNARSQAAIERLGAKRDGILRAHMRHRDGSLRNTYRYSILRSEWPDVERRLTERLEARA
ncbi:GNAT family N-acetyltransferase [Lysobacter xanthus]